MAKSYFNRYVWLIDTIQRHGWPMRRLVRRLLYKSYKRFNISSIIHILRT